MFLTSFFYVFAIVYSLLHILLTVASSLLGNGNRMKSVEENSRGVLINAVNNPILYAHLKFKGS